ncbi:MFS transporter [Sporolactobacillus shoreicorticis]|uniref:MFS transporter n=1 Tax=Sporolactobacillus shoreicorticis TaxID=1923877 RepID=A0ABW5SB01_9BACL|nr:MFS transporter [Sporolactobacillus shoreicorticis]MCO7128273.1 MFS transporter [Sporolactobacillus shoreicorticis]
MIALLKIFKNGNYCRIFFASFSSQLGTVTSTTAFTFFLLDQYAAKPNNASLVQLMYTLPSLFVFLIAGVLADHLNRQKIMIISDLANACFCFLLIAAANSKSMVFIFLLLFTITATSKFFTPAQLSTIQGILKKEEYPIAGGLNQMVASIFILFGASLGAFFYWNFGIVGAIIINLCSFLLSSLFIYRCKFQKTAILTSEKAEHLNITFVFSEFMRGLRYMFQRRLLRAFMVGTAILGLVNGGLSLMPVYLLKFKLAPESYQQYTALSGMVFGIGILSGSFVASLLAEKIKLDRLMILGYSLAGIFLSAEYFSQNVPYFIAFYFLTALTIPIVNVAFFGWLPQLVDPTFMGRVQALLDPIGNLFQSLLFGLLALTFPQYVSVELPFLLLGGCLISVALFYLIIFQRAFKAESVTLSDKERNNS